MSSVHASVSIVVSIKNEQEHIGELLDSVADQNYRDGRVEIIVVDGGSTDKTLEIVSHYPFVKLFKSTCNNSEGRNIGIKNASCEIVAFLDGDCVAEKSWLTNIVKHFEEDKELFALGGPYMYSDQRELFAKYRAAFFTNVWFPKKHSFKVPPQIFAGGNCAYRKRVFERVGYFNPLLGRGALISNGEDMDLNLRLFNCGYRLLYAEDVKVFHNYATTFKRGCEEALSQGKASSMYYAKFGQKGVLTNPRNLLLPLSILSLFLVFLLSVFLRFHYLAYATLFFFCYYVYKLLRFYIHSPAVQSKALMILAPFFDITLMVFWSIGSMLGFIKSLSKIS